MVRTIDVRVCECGEVRGDGRNQFALLSWPLKTIQTRYVRVKNEDWVMVDVI